MRAVLGGSLTRALVGGVGVVLAVLVVAQVVPKAAAVRERGPEGGCLDVAAPRDSCSRAITATSTRLATMTVGCGS